MNNIRNDFPFFKQMDVAFFDSAASAQKPQIVIDKLVDVYSHYANIHRGIYDLSAKLTNDFEKVRATVASFINAKSDKEIIFTKNATEGINLVAHSYGNALLGEGDEVLISAMEHHSNLVPWQLLCKEKKAVLKIIPIADGEVKLDEIEKFISKRSKLIAITHMSNVFGSIVNVKVVAEIAKRAGAKLLVDACQAIAHMRIDVQDLDCDFLVFSSHKLYGPTGVGVLYGKQAILKNMAPYQTGGSMVKDVSFDHTSFLEPPHRFEAGTPAIAEVIAFGEAINYLKSLDLEAAWLNENKLATNIRKEILSLSRYKILGNNDNSIISLLHDRAHTSDIGDVLNQCGVAIRTGHHCAQGLMSHLNITGTARISLGIYNDDNDVDKLISGLTKVNQLF